uniref:Uncharacterized protein n=1 Tax=Solanum tuberosum TaxID=4113 RepID=M1D8V4_SOLTU
MKETVRLYEIEFGPRTSGKNPEREDSSALGDSSLDSRNSRVILPVLGNDTALGCSLLSTRHLQAAIDRPQLGDY